MDAFLDKLTAWTEGILTWRKKRRYAQKEKQKLKNPVVDWIEAFLWSALMVLLVNQYFFQAYEIPSASMVKTLLVKDRLFVNKLVYGPEVLPGIGKLPGYDTPHRGDIIIFENPSYISKGPTFDLAQRLIYMLTLSLVDIDRDAVTGQPKIHFLIKRGAAYDGDRVRFRQGAVEIKLPGESQWRTEQEVLALTGREDHTRRVEELNSDYYKGLQTLAEIYEGALKGQVPNPENLRLLGLNFVLSQDPPARLDVYDPYEAANRTEGTDPLEMERLISRAYLSMHPQDLKAWAWNNRLELGQYVPRGWILPLGDNRDHSRDGRYFGPLPNEKILGQAALRIWPLGRFGEIK